MSTTLELGAAAGRPHVERPARFGTHEGVGLAAMVRTPSPEAVPLRPVMNRYLNGYDLLALGAVASLGLLRLPEPFSGDQALFTIMSRQWSDGGVLYRDLWDLKQPAIYAFYRIGGSLFGFTEAGIHVFELLYQLAFAATLILALRGWFRARWVATVTPLLVVGSYYAISTDWHLTQVEALVGFPVFVALWLISTPGREPVPGRFLASGVLSGVVLAFKLMYAPLVWVGWLVVGAAALFRDRRPVGLVVRRMVVPAVAGLAIPIVAMTAYFAAQGTLDLVYWTFFVYPPQAAAEWSPTPSRLVFAATWLIPQIGPLLPLAFVGAIMTRWDRDTLTLNTMLWAVTGLGAILIQTLSWWPYHFLLLLPPFGILAARGLDAGWALVAARITPVRSRWMVPATACTLFLLFVPTMLPAAQAARQLVQHGFALRAVDRSTLAAERSWKYRWIEQALGFLRTPQSLPGDIYVFGDPLILYLSGRGQAIPINGWSFDFLITPQWEQVLHDLERARPPYIVVERSQEPNIEMRHPVTNDFLAAAYDVLQADNRATVYRLRSADPVREPLP